MESLGAKNYVKDFSVDEEKALNPNRPGCPMALLKTEKVDFLVIVNIIAGEYKGDPYSKIEHLDFPPEKLIRLCRLIYV